MTPALRAYIESWLEKADNDLATAQASWKLNL